MKKQLNCIVTLEIFCLMRDESIRTKKSMTKLMNEALTPYFNKLRRKHDDRIKTS